MKLADTAAVASEQVEVPGGHLTVRGLGLDSMMFLLRTHGEPLRTAYQNALDDKLEPAAAQAAVLSMIAETPTLMACIIACGCGEPDEWERALSLPLVAQLDAIEKILRLTTEAEGGPKKLMETLVRLLQLLGRPAA